MSYGASTSNKDLAEALNKILEVKVAHLTPLEYSAIQEAQLRIEEMGDED